MDEYQDKSYGGGALKVGMLCCLCLETLLYSSFTITTKTNGAFDMAQLVSSSSTQRRLSSKSEFNRNLWA